jgi:hypothetical protein
MTNHFGAENIHFCLVAIGNPGYLGNISLSSITKLKPGKICVLVDEFGDSWLREYTETTNSEVCKHKIAEENKWILSEFSSKGGFEKFGSDKFFRLMFLKWIILAECLDEIYPSSFLIFSDLDVFWNKAPFQLKDLFLDPEKVFAMQDDSTSKRDFYCPGIMIWKNDERSKNVLQSIRDFHLAAFQINPYLPDDKAVNNWLTIGNNQDSMSPLPRQTFVIGHRILRLLLGISGFKLNSYFAFHANYCIGSHEKIRNLNAVRLSSKFKFLRYFEAFKIFSMKLKTKFL